MIVDINNATFQIENSSRKLETVAQVPGVSKEVFDEKVDFSKKNCPVSKALASVAELTLNATLK